jgi:hypothetical protein
MLKIFRKKYCQVLQIRIVHKYTDQTLKKHKLVAYLQVEEIASLQTDGFVS